MTNLPKCDDCGRFMSSVGSSAAIYDFASCGLDHEHFRCVPCTEKIGPVQSNARPHDGDMSPYQRTSTSATGRLQ